MSAGQWHEIVLITDLHDDNVFITDALNCVYMFSIMTYKLMQNNTSNKPYTGLPVQLQFI